MEYFLELFIFILKIIIIIGSFGLLIGLLVVALKKNSHDDKKGHLSVTRMNDHFSKLKNKLEDVIYSKKDAKEILKARKKQKKELENKSTLDKARLFVIDFKGDIKASAVESLREEITAILAIANPEKDSVVLKLESAGGMVSSYGLAASQLNRLTDAKINITVIIDKIAASGGYLMAATANTIIAAPFAIIGSIGVVATMPNINKFLTKNDIDIELHTSGEFKRTLTILGKNTEKGRKKFISDIQEVHDLFKSYVSNQRKSLNAEEVSTGEIWLGAKAIEKNLIDQLGTSDEYLYDKSNELDIFHVQFKIEKNLMQKIGLTAEASISNLVTEWLFKSGRKITNFF